jgi:hypothetical protein
MEWKIPTVAPCDHFADGPGAKHLGVSFPKIGALLAQGGAEPIDNDDLTHVAFSVRNTE